MSGAHSFPAPIGGVPFKLDFGPSVLFIILYVFLVGLVIYRSARSASRTIVLLGTASFVFERVVIYSLRANEAHNPSQTQSTGLTRYWQTALLVGYTSMLGSAAGALQCLLAPSTAPAVVPLLNYSETTSSPPSTKSEDQFPTQSRAKQLCYRICGITSLLSLNPLALGIVSGTLYPAGEKDVGQAKVVRALRYASVILAFLHILIIQAMSIWIYCYMPRIRRSAVLLIATVTSLLNVVSIYHLVIMGVQTTSILAGPLNEARSKVFFYVFQVAPEWLACAVLLSVNVREMFGTGLWGDLKKK